MCLFLGNLVIHFKKGVEKDGGSCLCCVCVCVLRGEGGRNLSKKEVLNSRLETCFSPPLAAKTTFKLPRTDPSHLCLCIAVCSRPWLPVRQTSRWSTRTVEGRRCRGAAPSPCRQEHGSTTDTGGCKGCPVYWNRVITSWHHVITSGIL